MGMRSTPAVVSVDAPLHLLTPLHLQPAVSLAAGMEFLAATERRATRLTGGLSSGGLHQLLQGFAELTWEPGSEFLAASEAAATDGLASLSPQELPELLIAYCRLGHQPGVQHMDMVLLETVIQRSARWLSKLRLRM